MAHNSLRQIRLTDQEVAHLDAMAEKAGMSRAAMIRDIAQKMIEGKLTVEVPAETRRITYWMDEELTQATEEAAKRTGLSLRDAVRQVIGHA